MHGLRGTRPHRAGCRTTLVLLGIVGAAALAAAQPGTGRSGEALQVAQAGSAHQTLPGGANSLQEAHGDWRVACGLQNDQRLCTLSQQLVDRDSHQRILAIELMASPQGQAEGTLVLPFGLALERGITLQVDETGAGPTLGFRTCLPGGCVVPVSFDAKAVAALKTGTTLVVTATGDNTKEVTFGVSLKGFASALDRTAGLGR